MFLDCVRVPDENPCKQEENTQTPHKRSLVWPVFEPRTFLQWVNSGIHHSTVSYYGFICTLLLFSSTPRVKQSIWADLGNLLIIKVTKCFICLIKYQSKHIELGIISMFVDHSFITMFRFIMYCSSIVHNYVVTFNTKQAPDIQSYCSTLSAHTPITFTFSSNYHNNKYNQCYV